MTFKWYVILRPSLVIRDVVLPISFVTWIVLAMAGEDAREILDNHTPNTNSSVRRCFSDNWTSPKLTVARRTELITFYDVSGRQRGERLKPRRDQRPGARGCGAGRIISISRNEGRSKQKV